MDQLNHSTLLEEGALHFAYWHHIFVLLTPEELGSLVSIASAPILLRLQTWKDSVDDLMSLEEYLDRYALYYAACISGDREGAKIHKLPPILWQVTLDSVYKERIGDNWLLRQKQGGIHIVPSSVTIAHDKKSLYPMTFGVDSIPWGVRISFPMLWENSKTGESVTAPHIRSLPIYPLWKECLYYIRHNTQIIKIGDTPLPIRVGMDAKIRGKMSCAIISIGDELLSGMTVNTNASFIAKALGSIGLQVTRVITIADEEPAIADAITQTAACDVVIITGGLGPTGDDTTKTAAAKKFNAPLVQYSNVYENLKSRYGAALFGIDALSAFPKGASPIENLTGTAFGFSIHNKYFFLPGFPPQMECMVWDSVIPMLQSLHLPKKYIGSLYLFNMNETVIDPLLRTIEQQLPGLQIGICPSWGVVSVYIQGNKQQDVDVAKSEIKKVFADQIFSEITKDIAQVVHEQLLSANITLAVVESCTGGAICAAITAYSGASQYFLGGLIPYANESKQNWLSIPSEILDQYGAVSRETATAMAIAAKEKTQATITIATTGIAGPTGGSQQKPVGTVYIALCDAENNLIVESLQCSGDRGAIVEKSKIIALGMIWKKLQNTHL